MSNLTTESNYELSLGPYLVNKFIEGLEEGADLEYQTYCDVKTDVDKNQYISTVYFGTGTAPETTSDGTRLSYQQTGELYRTTVPYNVIKLGIALTEEVIEDGDAVEIGDVQVAQLRRSIMEAVNVDAANNLNRAFNSAYPIGDGVSFVNAAHPGAPGYGTYSNLLNGALSQTPLETGLQQVYAARDPSGRIMGLEGEAIVVSPSLLHQASTLLASANRVGTANNDKNTVLVYTNMKGAPIIVRRMTSATNWFIKTSAKDGIVMAERTPLDVTSQDSFEEGAVKLRARWRGRSVAEYTYGWYGSNA